jgi:hypothetical protein
MYILNLFIIPGFIYLFIHIFLILLSRVVSGTVLCHLWSAHTLYMSFQFIFVLVTLTVLEG